MKRHVEKPACALLLSGANEILLLTKYSAEAPELLFLAQEYRLSIIPELVRGAYRFVAEGMLRPIARRT